MAEKIKKSLLIDPEVEEMLKFSVIEYQKSGEKVGQGDLLTKYFQEGFKQDNEIYQKYVGVKEAIKDIVCNTDMVFEYKRLTAEAMKKKKSNNYTDKGLISFGEKLYDMDKEALSKDTEDATSAETREYAKKYGREIFLGVWKFAIALIRSDYTEVRELKKALLERIVERNESVQQLVEFLEEEQEEDTFLFNIEIVNKTYNEYYQRFKEDLKQGESCYLSKYGQGEIEECSGSIQFIQDNQESFFEFIWKEALTQMKEQYEYEKGKSEEELAEEAFLKLFAEHMG